MCDPIYSFLAKRETLPILFESGTKTAPFGILVDANRLYRQFIDEETERRSLLNPESRLKYLVACQLYWRFMNESSEMTFVAQFIKENFVGYLILFLEIPHFFYRVINSYSH